MLRSLMVNARKCLDITHGEGLEHAYVPLSEQDIKKILLESL